MIDIEWNGVDWIDLFQGRVRWWALVDTVPNIRGPSGSGHGLVDIRVPYNARSYDWLRNSQLLKVGSNPRS